MTILRSECRRWWRRPSAIRANHWGYQTVPQRAVDGRVLPVPRGRVLGGCSSINGMVYFRGHPHEYDEWRQPVGRMPTFSLISSGSRTMKPRTRPQRHRGGPVNVIGTSPNPIR